MKRTNRLARDLGVLPLRVIPPGDPPTVTSNPRRDLVADLSLAVAANATTSLSRTVIRNQIADQTGLAAAKIYYLIRYIHVWSQSDTAGPTSTNDSLKMLDVASGVEIRDDPSPLENSRVGFQYPKNIQVIQPPTGDTPIVNVINQGTAARFIVRVGVTYWGASA